MMKVEGPGTPIITGAYSRAWCRIVEEDGSTVAYVPDHPTAVLFSQAENLLRVAEGALGYLEALPVAARPDAAWLKPLRQAIATARMIEDPADA